MSEIVGQFHLNLINNFIN